MPGVEGIKQPTIELEQLQKIIEAKILPWTIFIKN